MARPFWKKSATSSGLEIFQNSARKGLLTAPFAGRILGWQYLSPYGGKSEKAPFIGAHVKYRKKSEFWRPQLAT